MKFGRYLATACAVAALSIACNVSFAKADVVSPIPQQALRDSPTLRGLTKKAAPNGSTQQVFSITWGGDASTVNAVNDGIFKSEGLTVTLQNQNDLAEQVKAVVEGKTPFIRGTLGQIVEAAEALKVYGIDVVALNQLTFSRGGDALVCRAGITKYSDLKGKKIGLQLHGPHSDLVSVVTSTGGLKPSDVTLVYFQELTIPPASVNTNGKIIDVRQAFQNDPTLDCAFVIDPDAQALTDNNTGKGAEGVKGARILFSTEKADHATADLYVATKAWYDANKAIAQKFVHAQMVGQEAFLKLVAAKATSAAKYQQMLSSSATLLFDSATATGDVEGAIGGADFVGFTGNVRFFTGNGTTRNLDVMQKEIGDTLLALGLIKTKVPVLKHDFDFNTLTAGLTNVDLTVIPAVRFNTDRVQQRLEAAPATELDSVYSFEVYFAPGKAVFDAKLYESAFAEMLDLQQKYQGAAFVIVGHNSPDLIEDMKSRGESPQKVEWISQVAKTKSMDRAEAVRDAFFAYADSKGIKINRQQFFAMGLGVTSPKFPNDARNPKNRRVSFELKTDVDTELGDKP